MLPLKISNAQWKVFIVALGILTTVSFIWSAMHWERYVIAEKAGSLNLQFGPSVPGPKFPVKAVAPDSSAARQGVSVGDLIIFDRLSDAFGEPNHRYGVEDQIGLTVISQDHARHIFVHADPSQGIDTTERVSYFIKMFIVLADIIFSVLIGTRRSESFSARMLSLVLISIAFSVIGEHVPIGQIRDIFYLLAPISFFVIVSGYALFAMYFPHDHVTVQPLWLRIAAYLAVLVNFIIWSSLALWRIGQFPDSIIQIIRPLSEIPAVFLILISFAAIYYSYRRTDGLARQRVRWMILATVPLYSVPLIYSIVGKVAPAASQSPGLNLLTSLLPLLSICGLAYAVLRVRIFDFGFVINRALVYGLVSVILLTSFGLVEWMVEHLIHFEEREKNVLLDGAIAMAIYLSFHRLRHVVEHYIEQIFFSGWHHNEATLRRFIKMAAHIAASDALLNQFQLELKRFSGGADCSIYLQADNGNYFAAQRGLASTTDQIDVNDPIAVALRSGLMPIQIDGANALHANKVALPMSHRGQLSGFALIGEKPNREIFRPDEIDVLGFATHQIGLDLYALQNDKLKVDAELASRKIDDLNAKNEALSDRLEIIESNNAALQALALK